MLLFLSQNLGAFSHHHSPASGRVLGEKLLRLRPCVSGVAMEVPGELRAISCGDIRMGRVSMSVHIVCYIICIIIHVYTDVDISSNPKKTENFTNLLNQ